MSNQSASAPRLEISQVFRETPPQLVDWVAVFGNDRPVELEVGSGKGLFLATAAIARPGHNFVGIEIAGKYAKRTADRAAKLGLTNVAVYCDDARHFLDVCVPPASLAAIHVYFPDPWWKTRHKKRRVFTYEFVDACAKALVAGAAFEIATDVEEYFGVMTSILTSAIALFDRVDHPPTDEVLTSFERKYRVEGRPIFKASYRRT